ncbi:MAG: phosphatidate cytidylyltransferase [Bacteroidales bacterium]|nr:phosphatidate cytidylyltransferase [Bacteroidales bacterium]
MKNLLTRTFFGLIFAVIMIGSILYSPHLFAFVMLIVCFIGAGEVTKLHKKLKFKYLDKFLFRTVSVFSYLILASVALNYSEPKMLVLLLAAFLLPFLHALFSKRHTMQQLAAVHYTSLLFVVLPSGLMLFFFDKNIVGEMAGPLLLLMVIVLIWINDTFAYLIGVKFGKHRLFQRISPKKSWEGSIGGLFFSLLSAWILSQNVDWINVTDALSIALTVVLFGSLGDLVESMFKREAIVKDSGNILPGHGGVLDRFDATFFAVPFVFIYLIMIQ